jgi:molybdopterin biosynthesis enzyme MoaB
MNEAPALKIAVRILALGEAGARALPGLERVLPRAWAAAGDIELRSESAGDDVRLARRILAGWCRRGRADVVLTAGRAGHRREDFAPELAAALIQRPLPGIEERMCLAPPCRPQDLLFRGRAGFRGTTLLVNLPARTARAASILRMLAPVIGHALGKARGDAGECGHGGGR